MTRLSLLLAILALALLVFHYDSIKSSDPSPSQITRNEDMFVLPKAEIDEISVAAGNEAMRLRGIHRYKEALNLLDSVTPASAQSKISLSVIKHDIYFHMGNYPEALAVTKEILESEPTAWDRNRVLAIDYAMMDDFKGAYHALKKYHDLKEKHDFLKSGCESIDQLEAKDRLVNNEYKTLARAKERVEKIEKALKIQDACRNIKIEAVKQMIAKDVFKDDYFKYAGYPKEFEVTNMALLPTTLITESDKEQEAEASRSFSNRLKEKFEEERKNDPDWIKKEEERRLQQLEYEKRVREANAKDKYISMAKTNKCFDPDTVVWMRESTKSDSLAKSVLERLENESLPAGIPLMKNDVQTGMRFSGPSQKITSETDKNVRRTLIATQYQLARLGLGTPMDILSINGGCPVTETNLKEIVKGIMDGSVEHLVLQRTNKPTSKPPSLSAHTYYQ